VLVERKFEANEEKESDWCLPFTFLGKRERKNTLTKPMYFKTDSKVSKM